MSVPQFARSGDKQGLATILGSGTANVDEADQTGNRALHYSSLNGQADIVALLLGSGPEIDAVNGLGDTPLMEASRNGHMDIIMILLSHNADVNRKNNESMTPLHFAVMGGHVKVAQRLVDQGAQINVANVKAQTPLHIAAAEGMIEMVAYLIEKGANLAPRDSQGSTALSCIPLQERVLPNLPAPASSASAFVADVKSLYSTIAPGGNNSDLDSYSDLTFLVEGQSIPAHRNLVACRCSRLRKLIRGTEGKEDVEIKDVTANVLRAVIEYIYTDDVPQLRVDDPNLKLAFGVLLAADRYQLQGLRALCEAVIIRNLNTSTLGDVWTDIRTNKAVASAVYQSGCVLVAKSWDTVGAFKGIGSDMSKDDLVDMVRQLSSFVKKPEPRAAPSPAGPSVAKPKPPPAMAKPSSPAAPVAGIPHEGGVRLMDGKNLNNAKNIVKTLVGKKAHSWPFLVPVDPIALGVPEYFTIIKNPMDLGTIDHRLKGNYYRDVDSFAADVRLVFDNACLFNQPESEIVASANELRNAFESRMANTKWEHFPGKVSDYKFSEPAPAPKKVAAPPKKPAPSPSQYGAPAATYAHPAAVSPSNGIDSYDAGIEATEMTIDEKKSLGMKMNKLNVDQLSRVVKIINENRPDGMSGNDEDIEIDMNDLDAATLRKLEAFVNSCLPNEAKSKHKKKHHGDDSDESDEKKHKKKKHHHQQAVMNGGVVGATQY